LDYDQNSGNPHLKKNTLEILFLVFAWIVLAWCLLQIAMMDQAWPV
jgi:hypothetical protein